MRGSARLGWLRFVMKTKWVTDERIYREMEDLIIWYFEGDEDGQAGKQE